jgi:hypothetical protein
MRIVEPINGESRSDECEKTASDYPCLDLRQGHQKKRLYRVGTKILRGFLDRSIETGK